MASGKIHIKLNKYIASTVIMGLFCIDQANAVNVTAVIAGAATNTIVNPDLDVDGITIAESTMYRIFPPLGTLWYAYWLPYAKLIPHRSPLSHWPFLGTTIRVIYLLAPLFLSSTMTGTAPSSLPQESFEFLLYWFVSLSLCDIGHWDFDR